jgi:hypothetical protein
VPNVGVGLTWGGAGGAGVAVRAGTEVTEAAGVTAGTVTDGAAGAVGTRVGVPGTAAAATAC